MLVRGSSISVAPRSVRRSCELWWHSRNSEYWSAHWRRSKLSDFAFDRLREVAQVANHRLAPFVVGDVGGLDKRRCDVQNFETRVEHFVVEVDVSATNSVRREDRVSGDRHFAFRIFCDVRQVSVARNWDQESSGQEKEGIGRLENVTAINLITIYLNSVELRLQSF